MTRFKVNEVGSKLYFAPNKHVLIWPVNSFSRVIESNALLKKIQGTPHCEHELRNLI